MLDKFNSFILSHQLISDNSKVLLAVSGGMDSMCMVDLFRKSNYEFGIAHLNHGMRDASSDLDELLIREYAKKNGIPFFSKKINLTTISSNFQAEARKIRYEWLLDTAKEGNYQMIATAHHKDDQVENFFLRINRNAGINGLSGIKIKRDNIIRPLLFAYKNEIKEYVKFENIPFREDESNLKSKYDRNFFRNEIIPKIEERYSNFKDNILSTIDKIDESNIFIKDAVSRIEQKHLITEQKIIKLDLQEILSYSSPNLILFLILEKFGINRTQSDNLLEANTGGEVITDDKIFLKNRSEIIIKDKIEFNEQNLIINELEGSYPLNSGQQLQFSTIKTFKNPKDSNVIIIDPSKISLPLIARKRASGDYFFPFGMNMQKKSLKKYLIDQKLSNFEKEKINILVDAEDKIIWVIGLRADERFKIKEQTTEFIEISVL